MIQARTKTSPNILISIEDEMKTVNRKIRESRRSSADPLARFENLVAVEKTGFQTPTASSHSVEVCLGDQRQIQGPEENSINTPKKRNSKHTPTDQLD
jgi:hypothetical protein